MSLIPYPNVPPLPGVPAINRNSAGFVGAALNVVAQLIPNNLFGTNWAITDADGNPALVPDSFLNFEYKNERKIPFYPLESGSFSSYNKVAMPFDCRCVVTCSGNGSMSKQGFLLAIQNYLDSLTLLTISTPDASYSNLNLVHVDYRREARNGATLLLVQLFFQEIRIAQKPTAPTTEKPSGAATQSFGQLSPTTTPTGNFGSINPNARGATGLNPAIISTPTIL
jgi:hypothetical protein